MKIVKVVFRNGIEEKFEVDNYSIADNDICLYLQKGHRTAGMINLCEVKYFDVVDKEDD